MAQILDTSRMVVPTQHALYARQGDLYIWRVTPGTDGVVPNGGTWRMRRSLELLRGERTGHAHRIDGDVEVEDTTSVHALDGSILDLFVAVGKPVRVVHEEHEAIPLEPGIYHFSRQRVYDWDKERAIPVRGD